MSKTYSLAEILEQRNQDFLHYLASNLIWQERMSPKMQKFLFLASQFRLIFTTISAQFIFVNDISNDSLGNFLKNLSTSLSLFHPEDSGLNVGGFFHCLFLAVSYRDHCPDLFLYDYVKSFVD